MNQHVFTRFTRFFSALAFLAALAACSGAANVPKEAKLLNQQVTSLDGEPILLGASNREGLMKEPFKEWFVAEYTGYRPDVLTLNGIKQELREVDLLVFMGTWCSDSQREVPRMYKILDYVGFPDKKLTLINVDNHPDRYKHSPGGEHKTWNIENVPTVILLRDGTELGRIVEYPQETLERDLAAILKK